MTKLFPDIEEAKKLLREAEVKIPSKVKQELLEYLPGRMSRNIAKGAYYIDHSISHFPVFHTKYYVEAVKEVQELLRAEGYHVECYVKDYNGYYNTIDMLISWDIDHILNDEYLLSQYNSHKEHSLTRKTLKKIE